jgi:hypothetical protein
MTIKEEIKAKQHSRFDRNIESSRLFSKSDYSPMKSLTDEIEYKNYPEETSKYGQMK